MIYDYAIIGAGAAGLHLVLAMIEDSFFTNKKILILDKDAKETDDKTWSFWEKGTGKWDDIIEKSWEKGLFNTKTQSIAFDLAPYKYKTLRSINFYKFAKAKIAKVENIDWVNEEVKKVGAIQPIIIQGIENEYQARQVFDSRIDKKFYQEKDKYHRVLQHFKGWVIETEKPVFNPSTFVMFDFQVKWKNSTSFTYVLPTSPTQAMVEFTLFNLELLEKNTYDKFLKEYIETILKVRNYRITHIEYGVIPMTDYPFHLADIEGVMKIGTAGSWVKPSSGYAFKNIEKMVGKVIENLKNSYAPNKGLLNKRFRWYDALYLDVFSQENELGEQIFTEMYNKNSIQQIFKFLDEETSLLEELKIINSFTPRPFLKALVHHHLGFRIPI